MKSDKLYFFAVGFCVAMLISMVVVSWMPSPEPTFVCGGCGSPEWYSVLAEGNE